MTKEKTPNNDFDFEELHQQVSKLMDKATRKKRTPKPKADPVAAPKQQPKEVPTQKDEAVKVSIPPRTQVSPESEPKKEDKKSEPTETPVPVRRVAAARVMPKSRGMAMDVVQTPSRAPVAPPSARASRTAATIQPTRTVTPAPPSPRAAMVPEAPKHEVSGDTLAAFNLEEDAPVKPAVPKPQPPQKPELPKAEPGTEPAFPDPLEVHGFTDDEEKPSSPVKQSLTHTAGAIQPTSPVEEEDEDPLLREDELLGPSKNAWDMPPEPKTPEHLTPSVEPAPKPPTMAAEPSASPFVNAKVAKRPLGAFANETPKPVTEHAAAPEPPIPAKEPKPLKTEAATIAVAEPPKELNPEVVAVESEEPEFSPNNLRQMAIPPQYHSSEKEPSHDDRPMFDTKNYHTPLQPVAVPRHTGSKAGIVFTIILILLLIAAGVLAYFVATGAIELPKTL